MRRALRYPGQRDPDLSAFVENTIDAFAALHGVFWASKRFAPTGDLAWVTRRSADYGSSADLVGFAVKQLGERLPEASRKFAEAYLPRAERIPDLLAHGDSTLVHGDAPPRQDVRGRHYTRLSRLGNDRIRDPACVTSPISSAVRCRLI